MKYIAVIFFLAALSVCYAKHPVVAVEKGSRNEDADEVKDILNRILELRPGQKFEGAENDLGFSWSNCGKPTDPINVKSLTVSPDPVTIPGSLNISADVSVMQDIVAPTSLSLKVKKKLFGVFIEVPCIDNLGSCTYNNPCAMLSKITCPAELKKYGITCHCPIKKSEYKIPMTLVKVPSIKLPSIIENGDYKVEATLMKGSVRLGCYQIVASLKKA